ncbi:hypothetical protein IWW51_005965 [Coemansia sp. RSA 2702]|nr:hypothetical protein IWW54_006630 [Coemansia sp. RSA 2705]KAJ2314539.1 hypothetical protein IWW51_005965 [Coemansia sp. RSA 2702]
MASEDISKLQTSKNQELARIQTESADQTKLTASIQADTDERLAEITAEFEKNRQLAVSKLVAAVTTAELD